MAEIFLSPEDISANDTLIVLAFLNTVKSAKEIAARIEIPNELDIGVKLGQRILDAREQLSGRFSNLHELMNVPLIGSERFTEVVTEALHKSALEILTAQTSNQNEQLVSVSAQLNALKQWASEFENLNTNRYRVEISALDDTPYLGEVIPIRIRVWDRNRNTPKANLPLTIETNWGTLRSHRGLQLKQGSVITGHTSVGGEIHCLLYTPTVEPLTEAQQNELNLALAKLTHGSDVPEQARESFQTLAFQYQHPLNVDLRKAIDIHYKSRQDRIADSVNLPASVYSWVYEQALIRVYAHPQSEEEKSTVLAMSALPIEYRDWLSPWSHVYKESLVEGDSLKAGLAAALVYSEDEKGVVGHLMSNVHSFIASQNGLIGERIGQQASQEVLTRLLASDQESLTPNTKASLHAILGQGSSAITASGVGIANEVALDVGRSSKLSSDTIANLEAVNSRIDGLQSSYNGMNSRVGNIESATSAIDFGQLTADLSSFNSNYSTFTDNYSTFETNYSSFDINYSSFDNSYTEFNENYVSFNTDYGNFQTGLTDFNLAKDQIIVNVTAGVNAALQQVEANVGASTGTNVVISPIENVEVRHRVIQPPGRG